MPRHNRALGEAIDAGTWDAEAPLGRIVLVAHAAFLDAGFVPCGKPSGSHRIPGLTSSTLSLRYSIPELVSMRNGAAVADAAVLRLCAHGKFLIFYGYLTGDGSQPRIRWACIDALSVASLLTGDLDATAHALVNDAQGVELWKALADGLCRPLFAYICDRNSKLLRLRFLSLPADLQSAILRRISAVDLAMVECTCTQLRDLVAGRELWRGKYMVMRRFLVSSELSQVDGGSGSWKEMYSRAREIWASRRWHWQRPSWWFVSKPPTLRYDEYDFTDLDATELLIRRFREKRSNIQVGNRDRHQWAMAVHGNGKRRCRDVAINSPSSRHRWTHR